MEYRRRFGVIGELEFVDQRAKVKDQAKVERDALMPSRLDGQAERPGVCCDQRVDRVGGFCRRWRAAPA
jgi:hypothetical protein